MTRVVVDTETWAKLSNPQEVLEVCDQSGRTLVYSQPLFRVGSVEGGKIQSPYSVEELEELRKANRWPLSRGYPVGPVRIMSYTVVWTPVAEQKLAAIWNTANDRAAVDCRRQ